jgi:flagellin-like hook-associated protein FlgL
MTSIMEMLTAMRSKSIEYNSYTDKTSDAAIAAQRDFGSLYEAAKAAVNLDVGSQENMLTENQVFTFTTGLGTDEDNGNYASTKQANAAGLVAGNLGIVRNAAAGQILANTQEGLVNATVSVVNSDGMSAKYNVVFNASDSPQTVAKDKLNDGASAIFQDKGASALSIADDTGHIVDESGNIRYTLSGGKIYEGKSASGTEVGAYDQTTVSSGTSKVSVSIGNIKWKTDYVKQIIPADEEALAAKGLFTDPQQLKQSNVEGVKLKEGIKAENGTSYKVYYNASTSTKTIDSTLDGTVMTSLSLGAGEGKIYQGNSTAATYSLKDGLVYSGASASGTAVGYYNVSKDGVLNISWRSDHVIGGAGGVLPEGNADSLTVSWNSINKAIDGLSITDSEGISAAIKKVAKEQTKIGGGLNALDYISTHLSNMAAVQNETYETLTEADMAEEMTAYVKNNIYSQAAQAMIAQANQSMAQVLNLLQ